MPQFTAVHPLAWTRARCSIPWRVQVEMAGMEMENGVWRTLHIAEPLQIVVSNYRLGFQSNNIL